MSRLSTTHAAWIRWFDDISIGDVPAVGGKNASLGEMRRALTGLGVRIPDGFATTADAYRAFVAVSADEDTSHGRVIQVVDLIRQAGIFRLDIETFSADGRTGSP